MQYTLNTQSSTRQSLDVTVPSMHVDETFARITSRLASTLKLPGFRKGKVPTQFIMERFSKEVHQEVAESLVRDFFWEASRKAGVTPNSNPYIEKLELNQNTDAKFVASFDVAPELKLPNYQSLSLTKRKRQVDDDLIEEQLKDLQARAAKLKSVDTPVVAQLLVTCDLKVTPFRLDGKPEKTRSFKEQVIQIDETRPLDGALIGLKVDEVKEFTLQHSETDANANFAGKSVKYHVVVKDIRERVLAEINDDFAKDAGPFENLQALKDRLKKDLEEASERDAKGRLQADLLDLLLEKTTFDIPASMTAMQLDDYCREFSQQFAEQGMDPRRINWEAYREHRLKDAQRSIKCGYLLKQLGDAEKVEVPESAVDADIDKFMAENQIKQTLKQVKSELENRGALGEIKGRIRTEMIFKRLLELSTVQEILLDKKGYEALLESERTQDQASTLHPFDEGESAEGTSTDPHAHHDHGSHEGHSH